MTYLLKNEIRELHLELTNLCNAACPQCDRNVLGGETNPFLKLNSLSLADIQKIFPPDFCRQLEDITISGVHGDPMMAPEVLPILEYLKESGVSSLSVQTNGGMRTPEWWRKVAKTLSRPADNITFGIDGVDDAHSLYRRQTKWSRVTENMRAFIDAGGRARWSFLVFKHNEHQVEEARRLAKEWGCDRFRVRMTSRFYNIGLRHETVPFPVLKKRAGSSESLENYIEKVEAALENREEGVKDLSRQFKDLGFDYQIQETSRDEYKNAATAKGLPHLKRQHESVEEYFNSTRISCIERKDQRVYVDAEGCLWPCCYIGGDVDSWHPRHRFKEDIREKIIEKYPKGFNSLLRHGLDGVLSHPWFSQGLTESWERATDDPEFPRLKRCSRTCGEHYRPNTTENIQVNFKK